MITTAPFAFTGRVPPRVPPMVIAPMAAPLVTDALTPDDPSSSFFVPNWVLLAIRVIEDMID